MAEAVSTTVEPRNLNEVLNNIPCPEFLEYS